MSKIVMPTGYLYQLLLLSQTLNTSLSDLCSNMGDLSLNQYRCLLTVSQHLKITARDISTHTYLDKMSVSRSLRTLSELQLITISTSHADKRKKIIAITPLGGEKLVLISPYIEKAEKMLLNDLQEPEIQALDSIISALKFIAKSH